MSDKKNMSTPPTPDSLPKELSQDAFHPSITPSSSLQTVIKHNEDLMARLSVNLRRVGHLEKVIDDLTMRLKVEKASADSLRDELLIYTEKNRLSESQNQKMLSDLSRNQHKIEQLQTENESLKSNLKNLESKYEHKLNVAETEISELLKVKENAEKILKPNLVFLEDQIKKLNLSYDELRLKNEDLKEKLLTLSHQAQSEALKFQNISKDLQHKVKERDIIIKQYEDLDLKLKALSKDKAILENKNIDLSRELKKTQTSRSAEVENLQEDISSKASEIQKLKVENYELKKSWADSHAKNKAFEAQVQNLEEQAQSMNYMWQEKNRKYSEVESQNKIYETMRHDLSLKIKNYELELKNKNKKISDLVSMVESMKSKGHHEKEAIIETAIRGMRDLYFEDDIQPTAMSEHKNDITR